jgi:hypothetical protein
MACYMFYLYRFVSGVKDKLQGKMGGKMDNPANGIKNCMMGQYKVKFLSQPMAYIATLKLGMV